MTLKAISATELRTRTREIMQRAKFKHESFLVENFGEPMAVIVGVQEYEHLTKTYFEHQAGLAVGMPLRKTQQDG